MSAGVGAGANVLVYDAVADEKLFSQLDVSRCAPDFHKAVAFARQTGRWLGHLGLRSMLERLVKIGGGKPPVLYKDFAPYSFEFAAGGLFGGLIFHGSHDGGGNGSAPTFSVNLEAREGWLIHT